MDMKSTRLTSIAALMLYTSSFENGRSVTMKEIMG